MPDTKVAIRDRSRWLPVQAGYTFERCQAITALIDKRLWKECPACETLGTIDPDAQVSNIELGLQDGFVPCQRCDGLGWVRKR